MEKSTDPVRIDKWLWAARLFKTRALAAEAVNGGRVEANGQRAKASREVRVGDRLQVSIGPIKRSLVVLGSSKHRGPAPVAELLYEETAESKAARAEHAALRRLEQPVAQDRGGRPTKRDRRRFEAEQEKRRGG